MSGEKYYVSVGDNNTDFTPKQVDSLNGVAYIMKKYNYSMGVFDDNYRKEQNFKQADFIALDFDGGLTIKQAKDMFASYAHVIAPTRNHKKLKNGIYCDRFRVVLKLTNTVTDSKVYKSTVSKLIEDFPQADRACSDASRMFYHGGEVAQMKLSGKTVDPVKPSDPTPTKLTMIDTTAKGRLATATLDFIANGAPKGEWNPTLFKAAVDCMEQNYTKDECIGLLNAGTRHYDGELDESDLKTIDSAYNREPKHNPRLGYSMHNFKNIKQIKESKETIEWIVDGLLTLGGLSIFAGPSKGGKSTIARQLGMGICRGGEFLKRKVRKGKVMYLALEEQEALLKEQYNRLGFSEDDNFLVHVGPVQGANIEEDLELAIKAHRPTLVVIDTFILHARFDNLNDYNEVYQVLSRYRNMARATGTHIMCLHHQNKGENRGANSILGSSAMQGAVDCMMVLNDIPRSSNKRRFSSWQRGGNRFDGQVIEYVEETESYTLSEIDFGE